MKNLFPVFLFLSFTFMVSCQGKKTAKTTETEQQVSETPKQGEAKKVIVDMGRAQKTEGKTYRIHEFSIEGDVLSIDVSYLGGCGKHNFELYSNGLMKKSLPPQMDVNLEHTKEKETCNESVKQTLRFDLSSLNRQRNELIILSIDNEKNRVEWKAAQ